jgi:hypothetical protein
MQSESVRDVDQLVVACEALTKVNRDLLYEFQADRRKIVRDRWIAVILIVIMSVATGLQIYTTLTDHAEIVSLLSARR